MRRRLGLLAGLLATLVACGPATPSPLPVDVASIPPIIPGAVDASTLLASLTEASLKCTTESTYLGEASLRTCVTDNSDGADRAVYFVTFLADPSGAVRLVDAQSIQVTGARSPQRYVGFLVDTAIASAVPAVRNDQQLVAWIRNAVDHGGSLDVGTVHLAVTSSGQITRLQITAKP